MKKRLIVANREGLTLVELMIVLVLSMLLMGAVYMTFQLQHRSAESQMQVSAVQNDLRLVIDTIAVDIMNSGLSRNPNAVIDGIPADTSGASSLTLQMDFNGDGAVTAPGELITYSLDGANLMRDDVNAGVAQVLATNVTNVRFGYRVVTPSGDIQDLDPGAGTLDGAQAESVKFINVSVTKQGDRSDTQTGSPIQRTLSRWVCRRNYR